jgi:hypothetical protein
MSGTTSPVKSPGWFPLKDLDDHISPAYKHVVKDFKAEALDKSISHAKQHLPSLRPLLAERVIGPKTFMVALGKMSKDYSDKNQCQQSAAWTNTTATDVVLYLVEEVLYVVEEYGSLVPDSREDVYLEIQSHGKEGRANKDAAKFHGTWNRVLVPDQANHQAFRQRWCVLPGSTIRVGLANQSTTGTLFALTTLDLDSKGWQDNDRFIRNLPNRQERNSAEKMIRVNMLVNGDNGDRNVLKQRFSVGPPYGSEIESSKEYRFKATVTNVNNLINNGKSNVLVNHAKHKMLLICGGGKNKRGSDASGSTIVATVSLDRMFGGLESFPFSRDDPRRQLLPGDAAQFTLNPGISSAWFFALYVEEVKELSKFEENKIEADERAKWKKLEDFLQLEAKEDFPISRSLIESTFKLHQLSTEEQKGVRFRRLGGNQDWITKIAPTVDTENIYCIHASEFDENGNKRLSKGLCMRPAQAVLYAGLTVFSMLRQYLILSNGICNLAKLTFRFSSGFR